MKLKEEMRKQLRDRLNGATTREQLEIKNPKDLARHALESFAGWDIVNGQPV